MASRPQPRVDAPAPFRDAVAEMRAARLRPELLVEEMPAPQRIAPYAAALSADVTVDGEDVGMGRLVLLHDPAGNDTWGGTFRCVAYARAEVTSDLANDPMLAEVAWTWLTEALDAHGAVHLAVSGTVTKVSSESFGGMAVADDGSSGEHGAGASAQLEVRASWTPSGSLGPHVEAWGELLCTTVGLEPVPEGVTALPSRRDSRRTSPTER
jgi:hypothetical protein